MYGRVNCLSLKEHDSQALLKELVIFGAPVDAIIIDLDPAENIGSGKKLRLKRYSWFFSDQHVIARKQCDGALFTRVAGVEHLILIELKSSITAIPKARKQILAGKAFAAHVESLLGRPIRVCSRIVYIGPPVPPKVFAMTGEITLDRDIPVSAPQGRAYLSINEVLR